MADPADPPFAPRHAREAELFARLQKDPSADDARQVYADWLEENGYDEEATVLALERQLRMPAHDVEALAKSLRACAAKVPLAWRVVATRPAVHCPNRQLCPGSWEKLAPTPHPLVRHCGECTATVTYAPTIAEGQALRESEGRVALDVSVAEAPVRQITHDRPLLSLPLFTAEKPEPSIAGVIRGLDLLPPDELGLGTLIGHYAYPHADFPSPSNTVAYVLFSLHFSPRSGISRQRYDEISHYRYESVQLRLNEPREEVAGWLEERFGAPREVIEPASSYPDSKDTPYDVYGHWLMDRDESRWVLSWHHELPEWALAPTNEAAALDFVRGLRKLLVRWRGCSEEALAEYARTLPSGAGMEVPEYFRSEKGSVTWEFVPSISALDLAAALEIEDPYVEGEGLDSITYTIRTRHSKHYHHVPQYGKWLIQIELRKPHRGDILTETSRVRRLTVFPPY